MNGHLKKYPMKEIMQILPEKPGGERKPCQNAEKEI